MLSRDILLSFLEYNYQSDLRALQRVEELSSEQQHAAAQISHGRVYELVRHMADAEWSWRLFALGEGGQKYLWEVEDIPDLPALRRFWSAERERMLDYV